MQNGRTCLHFAAMNGQDTVVVYCVTVRGMGMDARDSQVRPCRRACGRGVYTSDTARRGKRRLSVPANAAIRPLSFCW